MPLHVSKPSMRQKKYFWIRNGPPDTTVYWALETQRYVNIQEDQHPQNGVDLHNEHNSQKQLNRFCQLPSLIRQKASIGASGGRRDLPHLSPRIVPSLSCQINLLGPPDGRPDFSRLSPFILRSLNCQNTLVGALGGCLDLPCLRPFRLVLGQEMEQLNTSRSMAGREDIKSARSDVRSVLNLATCQ